ncbi:ABC transporter permease [Minwuia thermotolerans]|uniref:ABC transporter permease n=1 Tax=Minwuia thermotolerans TaxID=2056226 RepID=A0A2M9G5Z5_9PROT|nr:ABC transporter permease [Minwuia thermotolerans]PJK31131.1 ABC transporter permease [Minwuia thermotolerans]
MELAVDILVGMMLAATPLLFAALGELVAERAGVLNLGVEGMMVVGAVTGFIVTAESGSHFAGIALAAFAGTLMGLLFGLMTQILLANQVATGLALTIFGLGLSALMGQGYSGLSVPPLEAIRLPVLSELPVLGPLLFHHEPMFYLSILLTALVAWFLYATRAGMILRAVGENHHAAHAIGFPVVRVRLAAVAFGGAMAGLGGAYLSVARTPLWSEDMTAGRGWIALAIVVFASWRPGRALLGAYLFGGVTIVQLHVQGAGVDIASQYLSMLPYLATIVVLVLISGGRGAAVLRAPGSLGRTFYASS